MPVRDGPATRHFVPVEMSGELVELTRLADAGITSAMAERASGAPHGDCVCWGIPFAVRDVLAASNEPITVTLSPTTARWLVFKHTTDLDPVDARGERSPLTGDSLIGSHLADYCVIYSDGSEERLRILRHHQVAPYVPKYPTKCFESVFHEKPRLPDDSAPWAVSHTRVLTWPRSEWVNWLWAWRNPHPDKPISGLRVEPQPSVLKPASRQADFRTEG